MRKRYCKRRTPSFPKRDTRGCVARRVQVPGSIMVTTRAESIARKSSYHRRHLLSKLLLLSICTSVSSLIESIKGNYVKTPRNNSQLSGSQWIKEILSGHSERFRSAFGISKHVFNKLLVALQEKARLRDSKHVTAEEQLGIFLYIATTGLSNRKTQERVQRSADTISR